MIPKIGTKISRNLPIQEQGWMILRCPIDRIAAAPIREVTSNNAGMRVKSSSSSFLRDSRGSGILPSRRNGERSLYLHIFLVTCHLGTGNGTGPAALSSWYESTTCTDLHDALAARGISWITGVVPRLQDGEPTG
jgi:hypothetical protein